MSFYFKNTLGKIGSCSCDNVGDKISIMFSDELDGYSFLLGSQRLTNSLNAMQFKVNRIISDLPIYTFLRIQFVEIIENLKLGP